MDILVSQLVEQAFAEVNVSVVVGLMALGYIIKHFKAFKNIDNNIIPPALLMCGIIAVVCMEGFNVQAIISGVVNAAAAVGLHQQGKNIFTVTVVPSISDLLAKMTNKTNIELDNDLEEEPIEDEEVDEVLGEDEDI